MHTEDLLKGVMLKWKGLQDYDEGETDVLGKDEGKGVGGVGEEEQPCTDGDQRREKGRGGGRGWAEGGAMYEEKWTQRNGANRDCYSPGIFLVSVVNVVVNENYEIACVLAFSVFLMSNLC